MMKLVVKVDDSKEGVLVDCHFEGECTAYALSKGIAIMLLNIEKSTDFNVVIEGIESYTKIKAGDITDDN